MASISNDGNGKRRILFVGADKKRRAINLKATREQALAVKVRVERIVASQITQHALDNETAEWVANLNDVMADKLATVGLIPRREDTQLELATYLDTYIAKRADVKPSTATVYRHTRRALVDFFGRHRLLRDISSGDADEWRIWLTVDQDLAESTVRRRCCVAKQFFRAAVRRRLLRDNPFADMKQIAVKGNPSRFYFVSQEEAQRVLAACPDADSRLIFALCRFGGLRCPSEHLELRWTDINWKAGRLKVTSPKTAHHEGKETRLIPIFPELRPHLAEAFDLATDKKGRIFSMSKGANTNLRTRFEGIIKRAGLTPWPKLFQNLRSTRQTELAESFPSHVVCQWIGNSRAVAHEHYLQVTEDHYEKALERDEQLAQNPAQHSGEGMRREENNSKSVSPPIGAKEELYSTYQYHTALCTIEGDLTATPLVGVTELESVTSTMSTWRSNQLS